MTLLSRPIIEATRSVRVSLDVEMARKRIAEKMPVLHRNWHPVTVLLALVGDAQEETDAATLRGLYIEIAAVAQGAAVELDREAQE
jgi:hypothetical protein